MQNSATMTAEVNECVTGLCNNAPYAGSGMKSAINRHLITFLGLIVSVQHIF